jgi:hypothetical protein
MTGEPEGARPYSQVSIHAMKPRQLLAAGYGGIRFEIENGSIKFGSCSVRLPFSV